MSRNSIIVDLILLVALTLTIGFIHLDHTPQDDELFHVLAAKSLLSEGSLDLPGGKPYKRAWIFTALISYAFKIFGESLTIARIPSVLAGSGLVLLVFLWVNSVAGRFAAWVAAALLCTSPKFIYLSQLARFYSLHAFCFCLGAFSIYLLLSPDGLSSKKKMLIGTIAPFALGLAYHLQSTTLIGVGALTIWILIVTGPALFYRLPRSAPRGWLVLLVICLALVVFTVYLKIDFFRDMWKLFRYSAPLAAGWGDNFRFYHWDLLESYATFWTLFPLLVVLASSRFLRPTFFCVFVFGIVLVVHSLAAWKNERYIFYVMPLFFAIVGMALQVILPWFVEKIRELLSKLSADRMPAVIVNTVMVTLLLISTLFFLAGNGAFGYSFSMLTIPDAKWNKRGLYRGEPDWQAAAQVLRPTVESSSVVVSSAAPKALYFLGRLDIILNEFMVSASALSQPVISSVESISQVISKYPTGLLVIERKHWAKPWAVPAPVADCILSKTKRIDIDDEWRLLVFQWGHPE